MKKINCGHFDQNNKWRYLHDLLSMDEKQKSHFDLMAARKVKNKKVRQYGIRAILLGIWVCVIISSADELGRLMTNRFNH